MTAAVASTARVHFRHTRGVLVWAGSSWLLAHTGQNTAPSGKAAPQWIHFFFMGILPLSGQSFQ